MAHESEGVTYETMAPTMGRANYRVLSIPEGMDREDAAVAIDDRAGLFGHTWSGDVLSVYTG